MANTYTQIYIQIVIVVKGRHCLIPGAKKENLYKYMTGIIRNKKHKLISINGVPNHIHFLIGLNPAEALSDLVKEVKRCSTNYVNEQRWLHGKFSWQEGYGGFSYSRSQLDKVIKYIENQEKHHQKKTFREEYIEMLKKFEVVFYEKFIFEDVE
ncbi:MAG: transposase [Ignavibacteria bacterium RIFOXYB2_FULL_35_12]|nr:MAG: transposase [Ignavibacteria bacterium GWA2_36_19]OGU59086.1 MAG: transposase [Ignavibacteria bacterium GWF2_35_20]OGU79337.1 MAG: transposase [Ignavibacteria bacterium RIFOXYA2_FULL_35_9]OGU88648.1 MAG: transposase [Ignavibacteria bacterium RIFOXYA12_FULL_35_25]OGU89916.1 MAG: transposase [Ignavibacteria bacterium RIFOXYC12_FULL_35_11]OGU96457.1 MAG: transposase [Ignavibacteria bacterium RIFOXYB12_FULL_35_14]OGV00455.1 MAG: transposase [Ignavibacteria bacterium RIFOXYC2_FULL_35_16]OG